jgi:hypothetical protein
MKWCRCRRLPARGRVTQAYLSPYGAVVLREIAAGNTDPFYVAVANRAFLLAAVPRDRHADAHRPHWQQVLMDTDAALVDARPRPAVFCFFVRRFCVSINHCFCFDRDLCSRHGANDAWLMFMQH